MTKVLPRKPGPKSSKQSKILAKRGTLGETSCESNSDDSSADHTVDGRGTAASKQKTVDASDFGTPEAEKDATDYGLEFTTSHIQNPSPRRCSTLRTAEISQEQQRIAAENTYNSTKDNDTPTSSLTNKPSTAKSKPLKKVTKSKAVAKTKETPSTETQDSAVATQPVKKPRKQRNPLQVEKRFWKDVRILQNRTDNLIPMLPFSRLIREIMHNTTIHVTKITPTALEALQTSAELYLTQRLQDAYMLTLHRGRVTLDVKDLELINFLKMNL